MAFRSILLIAFCRVTVLAQLSTTTDPSTPTIIPVKPETNSSGDVDAQYRLEFDKCTDDQVAQIKSGFADAITMIMGRNTWTIWPTYPTVDWNSGVAQDFWGPAERNLQYRELIQGKLRKGIQAPRYTC